MSAGVYRNWLRLKTPHTSDDGQGGQTTTWTDSVLFAADLRPLSSHEQSLAGAIQSIATHRATMIFDHRVLVTCRFGQESPAGADLQIVGIRDVDGRQRWMEVDCAEVV